MKPIGIGVVGLGFMGRQHAVNAAILGRDGVPCRLQAVCSRQARSLDDLRSPPGSGNIEDAETDWPADLIPELTDDFTALLGMAAVDLVVVSTPTPDHVPMTIAALEAGKHVLVEKPVSITARALRPLVECAGRHRELRCMPAHVMRFWPGWLEVADWIRDGKHGRVLSATFRRLGSVPDWNQGFYLDLVKSGGALGDLHVHDVDFILHCFGEPTGVHVVGDPMHVTACFGFADGPGHVVAEAAWDQQPGAGFLIQFTVNLEQATLDFDSSRPIPLRIIEGDRVTEWPESVGTGYAGELRALVESIAGDRPAPVSLADAERAAGVIDLERAMLEA